MKILLIFIDGLGLGEYDESTNPLVRFDPPFFRQLLGQPFTKAARQLVYNLVCLVPIDACLDTPGLPQSATGQTALFTGENAPKFMGRHIQGFPGPALTAIIKQHGILRDLHQGGYRVTSANMYTPDYLDLVAKRKRRHSVTSQLILTAGLSLRSLPDMKKGEAIYQDLTNELLPELGFLEIPLITPSMAGKNLVNLANQHHFTLFEYFQTDRQGHKQNWDKAEIILSHLNEFLTAIYFSLPSDMLLIVTSDHGNFEDFSVRTHTRNAVPGFFAGYRSYEAAQQVQNLTDVTPLIKRLLRSDPYD